MLPAGQKNWLYNKVFWRAKYLLKKTTTTTAQQHGFGGNTEETDNAAYDATVENFARGHAATQGQAESMANTIQQQQQTINIMQQQFGQVQYTMNSTQFQQQQYQQPMQQQQQRRRPLASGGRGGQGGGWQQQAWGQMQQQPNTYQPNTNFNGNQSFGGGN